METASRIARQHGALNQKHLIESYKSWKSTLVQILPPLIFVLLSILSAPTDKVIHHSIESIDTSLPPSCNGRSNCRRIMWGPYSNVNYNKMVAFAEQTSMTIAPRDTAVTDLEHLKQSAQFDISCFNRTTYSESGRTMDADWLTAQGINLYVYISLNMSQDRVCSENDGSAACTAFVMYTNGTSTDLLEMTTRPTWDDGLHLAMQKALYKDFIGEKADVVLTSKKYPDRERDRSLTVQNFETLGLIFALTFGMIFIFVNIVAEAESGMRGYLKSMGLPDWIYWSSWFTHHLTIYTVVASFVLILGYTLSNLRVFHRISPGIICFLFFSYGVALILWSTAWSTLFRSSKTAFALSFFLFLLAIGLGGTTTFSAPTGTLEMENPSYKLKMNQALYMVPPWAFCRFLIHAQTIAINSTDDTKSRTFVLDDMYTVTRNFTWSVYDRDNGYVIDYWALSWRPVDFIIGLWVNSLVYLILMVYIDKVFPDNNKSTLQPWFFVMPSFWMGNARSDRSTRYPTQATDPDILNEIEMSADHSHALTVQGLTKHYVSTFRRNRKLALENVYLSGDSGTIMALLGHNGAGKTTMINILTGKTAATSGDATIFGVSALNDMTQIQSSIGICPQFDVLWPDLTARQHMSIMSRIKRRQCNDYLDILRRVDLHNVEQLTSSQFSGGMKRRLQVALSVLGEPNMLILDEPTTGMDPVNRRKVWQLIKSVKENKLIFLTTHAMEEAEVLGEKIAIMVDGQLRTVGSNLRLKTKHATGYRLQLIAMDTREDDVIQLVSSLLPSARLGERSGSSIVFSIQNVDEEEIGRTLEALQKRSKSYGGSDLEDPVIRDWGLSNSTLEDVFLQVTRGMPTHQYGTKQV